MATKDISIESIMLVLNELTEKFKESERRYQEIKTETQEIKELLKSIDKKLQNNYHIINNLANQTNKEESKLEAFECNTEWNDRLDSEFEYNPDNKWAKIFEEEMRYDSFIDTIRSWQCTKQFVERGINIHSTYIAEEGYLVLGNDKEAIVVSAKIIENDLNLEYIDLFLKSVSRMKKKEASLEKKQVYAAIATIRLNEELRSYAERKGLFIIENSREGLMSISNPIDFKPKEY